jgi:hypothetical protein
MRRAIPHNILYLMELERNGGIDTNAHVIGQREAACWNKRGLDLDGNLPTTTAIVIRVTSPDNP